MATLSHTESRRLYSWWWDSHISPKNSKWLQENLTDMDAKVKAMIKLIEEDADSFARRAEMYYKKRPELMKLVEEFYRAYRALAERYDYATGELRQAHRTMAEAFPNQVPFVLADDSPAGSSTSEAEPHTPEMPHPIRALFDPDDLHKDALGISSSHAHDTGTSKKGLKQLNEIFGSGDVAPHHTKLAEGRARKGLNFHNVEEKERSLQDGVSQLSTENQNLKIQVIANSERVGKAEAEVQTLREALAKLEAEKEAALIQFQQSSEKLSNLETEVSRAEEDARGLHEHAKEAKTEVQTLKEALAKLEAEKEVVLLQYQRSLEMLSNLKIEVSRAQEDARRLDERTNKAENEVQTLKEALAKLEAEKGAVLLQCQQYLEMISNLESKISHAQEDARRLNERASKAEIEAQTLKQAFVRLEAEKEAGLLHYKQCLEMIPNLETKISVAEEDARKFNEQADKAETEVQTLKQAVAKSEEEKEAATLQYQQYLEMVSILETEISRAQEEARRLNDEIMMGVMKLDRAEEKCLLLERENQSLHSEVESLVQKTGMQNQELSEKHGELERLRICIQEARLRFLQAEAAIQTLENLHTRSQDEKTALALELQNEAQMLKDIELRNYCLEDEVKRFKEENTSLNEQNLSSAMSIKNLQEEIFSLKAMERKLEGEVEFRVDQRNALQQEIYCLREEINDLNRKHQVIMEQVESVGLDPEYIGSSVKELQDENSKLKQRYQKENDEKVGLLEKLKNMERLMERNTLLENSLSDVNAELEGLREKLKTLEESFQTLQGEKSTLVAEKATLASQLETITDNMKKLSEEKTSLETSLSVAIVELEGLREKSKSLEESYQSLDNENSGLLSEKDTLVSQLESIRQRLDDLEKRYAKLEEKYLSQEKEKEFIHCQVEELRDSLNLEKQERANSTQLSEIRLVRLENQICLLQEEGQWRKRDFEEELDKAVKAHVEIFILQSCMRDMEEKNISLLIECQKHFEASKLSEKLISELDQENHEQQEEVKSLLDQIKKLTTGIHQMLKLLEIDTNHGSGDKIKEDQTLVQHILGKFDDMKSSLLENQDQRQHLLVEKLVFDTLLRQLRVEAADLELERNTLDQELKTRTEVLLTLQSEKHKLLELNEQLRLEVVEGDCREVVLKAGMENLCLKLSDLQEGHVVLVNENSKLFEDNCSLMKEFSDLKEEKCMLEEENCVILGEAMALDNLSLIFKSFAADKAVELKGLSDDLDHLSVDNCGLEKEVTIMKEKLGKVGTENLFLKESVEQLENELNTVRNASDQLNHQMAIGKDLLIQKETEYSEAEQKLNATKSENAELHRDLEVLKRENDEAKVKRDELEKQILELSEDNSHQKKEIGYLHEMNGNVRSELGKLSEEIEELRTREGSLNSELQERRHEVELWELEASTFYDDLHISTVREALFKDKVHELTGACVSLEDEAASKNVEIEQLKERVSILGSENEGLKAEMIAYLPVIVSLRDSIASLEDHAILQTNRHMGDKQKPTDAKLASHQLSAVQNTVVPEGVLELQQLQTRVKAVESTMLEMENFAMEHIVNKTIKLDAAMKEIEELKSKNSSDNLKLLKTESETSEVRNVLLMKDIPLDQISDGSLYDHGLRSNGMSRRENGKTDDTFEFWETAEGSCSLDLTVTKAQKLASALILDDTEYHQMGTVEEQKRNYRSSKLHGEKELGVDKLEVSKKVLEPRREGSRRKILERLDSDAQKLMNLQVTLHDLKTKVETSEKTKKAKGAEYDTVKRQLEEVEAAIMQLVGLNGKLMRNAEEESLLSSSNSGKASTDLEEPGNVRRRRVLEQARRGSEKIGRLQLEMQRIQFVLLKLEAENERKGKIGVTERRSKVLLRDYIYGGRDYIYYGGRSSNRRKKASFCACAQPSTKEE